MAELRSKRILLGLTGGIAAYKSAELVRELQRRGADIQVVMTESACKFITPLTLQALSGKPVYVEMWDDRVPNGMPHIELSRGRARRDGTAIASRTRGSCSWKESG
jgi:phosphopantothenoylcysteine decarboxylase/phosphopantothenate--cysteine ligase